MDDLTFIVVDDAVFMRTVLKKMLIEASYQVVGEAGILVNPDSVVEISKAITKILDGEENYINNLITKGKEQAKKFTWENSTKLLEDIYEMM